MGNTSSAEDDELKEYNAVSKNTTLNNRLAEYLPKRCPIIMNLIVGTLRNKTSHNKNDVIVEYRKKFNTANYRNEVQRIKEENRDVANFEEYVTGLSRDFLDNFQDHNSDVSWEGTHELSRNTNLEKFLYQIEDMIKSPDNLVIGDMILSMFVPSRGIYVLCNEDKTEVDTVYTFLQKLNRLSYGKDSCENGGAVKAINSDVDDFVKKIGKASYSGKEWQDCIATGVLETYNSNHKREVLSGHLRYVSEKPPELLRMNASMIKGGAESDTMTAMFIVAIVLLIVWYLFHRPMYVLGVLLVFLVLFHNAGYFSDKK